VVKAAHAPRFPRAAPSLAPEAGPSQRYSCKEVYENTVSGDCMFLHVFEDEQNMIESKYALSGAS